LSIEVRGSLEELRELFLLGASEQLKKTAKKAGKKLIQKTEKKILTVWQKFLRDFKFRKQRRNEKSSAYFGLRTKAASRAYKKLQKKRGK